MKRKILAAASAAGAVAAWAGLAAVPQATEPRAWPALARYEAMVVPPDNPLSAEKVALGRQLFFDERMSGDRSAACASCHQPERGLTDGRPRSIGAYGMVQDRSCPSLWNVGYQQAYFWEGSAPKLEAAILGVWRFVLAPGREGRASAEDVAKRLSAIPGYQSQFLAVFGGEATVENVPRALAAFLRTLVASDSAWVRFQDGDSEALSGRARRGWAVFDGKAKCTGCHNGLLLTDLQYHNVGIGAGGEDLGRFDMTKEARHRGAFKTPTLLNISRSAPYFHDGSVATLPEAVDRMAGGGVPNANLDDALKPVKLTPAERADLLAFLEELTVDTRIERPRLPE
jgi:cytochrome c peroxidase